MGLPFLPVRGVRGPTSQPCTPSTPGSAARSRAKADRGTSAASGRRAAARAAGRPARQPAPGPALRARRTLRVRLADGRRHRRPARSDRRGRRRRGRRPRAPRGRRGRVPFGAHPSSCYPGYAYDRPHLANYLSAAHAGGPALADYLERLRARRRGRYRDHGPERPARLAGWSDSTDAWQELFGDRVELDAFDEWFVVALARTIRPARDGLPRLRQPVRPGRHARGPAHPRPHHAARRGGDVRGEPRTAVHPAHQQRRSASPRRGLQHAVRGVLRRRDAAARRPDVPLRRADRRPREHQRHRHGAGPGAPEDQARGWRRRLQHVRHHRRAHPLDHPAPVRAARSSGTSTSSPTSAT